MDNFIYLFPHIHQVSILNLTFTFDRKVNFKKMLKILFLIVELNISQGKHTEPQPACILGSEIV